MIKENIPVPKFDKIAPEPKIEVSFSLATPMLGGGAMAGRPDLDEPFRPSAIRNGIRWWWRRVWLATTKINPVTPEELAKAEAKVWGTTDHSGSLQILVTSETTNNVQRIDHWGNGKNVDYAWQVMHNHRDPSQDPYILEKATGNLDIRCELDAGSLNQLTYAVWLWLTFGGVGARTRKGFGVLNFDYPLEANLINGLFTGSHYHNNIAISQLRDSKRFRLNSPSNNPLDAWASALIPYRDFRKGNLPSAGKRENNGMESHSRWPEADLARQKSQRPPATHQNRAQLGVPRANLGLPLMLHSVGNRDNSFPDWNIEEGEGKRRPSPVVIRPIKENGRWFPSILVLKTPDIGTVEIEGSRYSTSSTNWPSEWYAGNGRFERWEHGESNAVNAFVKYLREKAKWEEVKL